MPPPSPAKAPKRPSKKKPKVKAPTCRPRTVAEPKPTAKKNPSTHAKAAKAPAQTKTAPKHRVSKKRLPLCAVKKKPAGVKKPSAAAPPVTAVPAPLPVPPPAPPPAADPLVFSGPFTAVEAERLLWRAGFGSSPGQADRLAALGLDAAVRSLVAPAGDAVLEGPEPKTQAGAALAPGDLDGHDHLWWMDRMVRGSQPLVERMTLVWHDWFATSDDDVGQSKLMLDQNAMLRRRALGRFSDLVLDVAVDPAMLVYLSGKDNRSGRPNENFARELMELFTLGADRGAYTEDDVRELARALTGWRADYVNGTGWTNFRFDPARADTSPKTVFAQRGSFGWRDAIGLCLDNPYHRSFFVTKLWSYFVPSPPDPATQAALEALYVATGGSIAAVVEAILKHPDLYAGGTMVQPPVVYAVGLLRVLGRGIDTTAWTGACQSAGQRLFHPPNVAGWNDQAWLDTSTFLYRWNMVGAALGDRYVRDGSGYPAGETPEQAVDAALATWGRTTRVRPQTLDALLAFARTSLPVTTTATAASTARGQRQNALRHLLATSPDLQTS